MSKYTLPTSNNQIADARGFIMVPWMQALTRLANAISAVSSNGLIDNSVTYSKLQKSGANTVLGNPTNSTADVQEIATTGTDNVVRSTSPTLVTPALGTPTSVVLTNATGTASGLTSGHVTTNANLTGPITSAGNVTSVSAQTGIGSTFVMNTSPTLVTPALGTPSSGILTNCTALPSSSLTGTTLPSNIINSSAFIKTIKKQIFVASGTYTPSAGMLYCEVEVYGGGGGGGSSAATIAGHNNVAGGGGASGYCKKLYTSTLIGATATVTIGAAGSGGASGGNNAGGTGGTSIFTPLGAGVVLTVTGGGGGSAGSDTITSTASAPGSGGFSTNGDVNISGGNGGYAFVYVLNGQSCGYGGGVGSTPFTGIPVAGSGATISGRGPGGGGSGAWLLPSAASLAGGNGIVGQITIIEYCTT